MAKQARHNQRLGGGRKAAANMVIMAEHSAFARSFDALFAEGMALADKVTADFERSAQLGALRALPPAQAECYARERKRLGGAALKMAAWLWLERALREGDISAETAAREKEKLRFALRGGVSGAPRGRAAKAAEKEEAPRAALPPAFQKLRAEIEHFIERIRLMDKEISRREDGFSAAGAPAPVSPVSHQWQALRHAFKAK